ncbi:MAG: polyprenyl synthetase family protein [Desulfobacteraceae bacterium]
MKSSNGKAKFTLSDYLARKREIIDHHLRLILEACDGNRELTQAMEHSLMAGGKRLRPVLAMAAARAAGKNSDLTALPCACAIEMIHTYSLIHDDLPAMDDDDLRRGKLTCHNAFSEATAILAGDALLTHAFQVLTTPERYFSTFPDKAVLFDIIGIISHAAGVNGMIQGQMLDMLSSSSPPSQAPQSSQASPSSQAAPPCPAAPGLRDDKKTGTTGRQLAHLETIHSLKTGKMILASLTAGAVSAGADQKGRNALVDYGRRIGLAFQVTDDILNVEGDPAVMGKAAGSDAEHDKATFPALLGLDSSKKYAKKLVDEAVDALRVFDNTAAMPLEGIAEYILTRTR